MSQQIFWMTARQQQLADLSLVFAPTLLHEPNSPSLLLVSILVVSL